MQVNDLVVRLSKSFVREVNEAMRQGLSMNDASIAQVIVAKIILADPANKDNLDTKVDFLEPGRGN